MDRLDDVHRDIANIVYLGIPGFPPGMPYGFVRIFYFFYLFIFLLFRRQGFRMITFDRQAGPLQNFNQSHVMMVIGRVYRPKIPPPPPPRKKLCMRFRTT